MRYKKTALTITQRHEIRELGTIPGFSVLFHVECPLENKSVDADPQKTFIILCWDAHSKIKASFLHATVYDNYFIMELSSLFGV